MSGLTVVERGRLHFLRAMDAGGNVCTTQGLLLATKNSASRRRCCCVLLLSLLSISVFVKMWCIFTYIESV